MKESVHWAVTVLAEELRTVTQWVNQLRKWCAFGDRLSLVNGWVISNTIRIHIRGDATNEILEPLVPHGWRYVCPLYSRALIGVRRRALSSLLWNSALRLVAGMLGRESWLKQCADIYSSWPNSNRSGRWYSGVVATSVGLGDERNPR